MACRYGPRREDIEGQQQDSFGSVSTWLVGRSVGRLVSRLVGGLVWESPSLATMGSCENEWIRLGWCV